MAACFGGGDLIVQFARPVRDVESVIALHEVEACAAEFVHIGQLENGGAIPAYLAAVGSVGCAGRVFAMWGWFVPTVK